MAYTIDFAGWTMPKNWRAKGLDTPENSGYNAWDYLSGSVPREFTSKSEGQRWLRAHHKGKDMYGINAKFRVIGSRRSNPSAGRRQTVAQKREKSRKASTERRVATALAKFLKANPATRNATGAKVQKLAGGVLKITPIRGNAAKHWQGWMVPGVNAGFKTKAAAQRHIWEHDMVGVKPVRVKKPSDQLTMRGSR